MLQISTAQIAYTTFWTFAATAAASYIGLQGGSRLGHKAGKKAEIWGGVILIVIGMKILIEHMEFMG
jgi:putative Mn2+ efflux pump MntP